MRSCRAAYRGSILVGVVGLVVACGSSDSDAGADRSSGATPTLPGYDGPSLPPTPGPLAVEDLGDAFETILCEALTRCRDAGYRDVAHCKADREPEGARDVIDGVAEGRIAYDAAVMGDCRRLFERNLCALASGFLFVPTVPEIVELCTMSSSGTQDEGEPCRSDIECRRDLFCDEDLACPGTCRVRASLGAACTRNDECAPLGELPEVTLADLVTEGQALVDELAVLATDCVEDVCRAPSAEGEPCPCVGDATYCDLATDTCALRGAEGDACAEDAACTGSLWCDRLTSAGQGTCVADSAEGGPCQERSHCEGDLRCLEIDETGRGRCGPRSGEGGWCDFDSDCALGLGCNPEGSCILLPGADTPCLGGDCAPGFVCQEDVCLALSFPGEPCDDQIRPCAGVCRGGICDSRAGVGESCAEDSECTSRACVGGVCIDDELCENRGT